MKNFHLVHDGDQWKLTPEGGQRATAAFGDANKQEAVQQSAARLSSSGQPASLKIHGMDGKIQEERTYPGSADPKKSPG